MENQDIRWIQHLQNYKKVLKQLQDAVQMSQTRELTNLENQGLIKAFEFTHELAWNVMKDYSEHQGYTTIRGSRDATRAAFKIALIRDGEGWMEMIKSRNQTAHTYNESTEDEIDDLLLPYMIDLSVMKKIENPDLIEHIQRVGQVFYQKQEPALNNN